MLTTATMIKLGKVYGNMMVDLNASNIKLVDRATRIVKAVTGVEDAAAKEVLEKSNYNSKLAIMMILSGCPSEEAARILQDNNGYLKQALSKVKG